MGLYVHLPQAYLGDNHIELSPDEVAHEQLKQVLGDYLEDWIGQEILLYVDQNANLRGKTKPRVRVKKAEPKQQAPAPSAPSPLEKDKPDYPDEDIPF